MNIEAHDDLAIDFFLLVYDHMIDQRMQKFRSQLGDIRVLFNQLGKAIRLPDLPAEYGPVFFQFGKLRFYSTI